MLIGRLCGGTLSIACPSITMLPEVTASNPASMRRSVVLPDPDAPRSEKNSPALICSDTSRTACTWPKDLVTFRIEITRDFL